MITPTGFIPFEVVQIVAENERTRSIYFGQTLMDAQPGQYIMAWLPAIGEKPFSIAGNNPLKITVVAVGPVSEALCGLQTGDRVWIRGPLGNGYRPSGKRHLLVGGGYGAAPLFFLAQEIQKKHGEIQVCLGARNKNDLLLSQSFLDAGCRVLLTTDDGSAGQKGLVTQAVQSAITEFSPDTIYACGPVPMLVAISKICQENSIDCQLSWEALIRCGMGLCGSCELEPNICQQTGMPNGWLTCKDGPVFKRQNNP